MSHNAVLFSAETEATSQAFSDAARRTACANNLKQIGIGLQNYLSSFQTFPPGMVLHPQPARQMPAGTWLVHILPQVEQNQVYDNARDDWQTHPSPFSGHFGFQSVIPLYQCPSDPRSGSPQWTHQNRVVGLTNYVGVVGTDYRSQDGILFVDSKTRAADIRDGLSQTLLVAERPPSTDHWYGRWYAGTGQLHNGVPSGSPDMLLGARERNDSTTYDAASCPPGPYVSVCTGQFSRAVPFVSLLEPASRWFTICDGRWFGSVFWLHDRRHHHSLPSHTSRGRNGDLRITQAMTAGIKSTSLPREQLNPSLNLNPKR